MTGVTGPDQAVPAEDDHRAVVELVTRAFGPDRPTIGPVTDVNRGRGVFSIVLRVDLDWTGDRPPGAPDSVVAKLPTTGANRRAAVESSAYRRECLAYRDLLTGAPIGTPTAHAVVEDNDGTCRLLLEDLTSFRAVDQLRGLDIADAELVAERLAVFHHHWRARPDLGAIPVRTSTVKNLPVERLQAGLVALDEVWGDHLTDQQRAAFHRLLAARNGLEHAFSEAGPPTLCHGDPRADNLVFVPADRGDDRRQMVLFDWQQMAIQFGEADLAWLAATSLDPDRRRLADDRLVAAYDGDRDRYRVGFVLPGLAVLLLAQRDLTNDRQRRFVATSLRRIATALTDLDVADTADRQ